MALSNGWRGTWAPRLTAAGQGRYSVMHARTVISGYVATVATMPAGKWTMEQTISHAQDRGGGQARQASAGSFPRMNAPPMAPLTPSTTASDGMVLRAEAAAVLQGGGTQHRLRVAADRRRQAGTSGGGSLSACGAGGHRAAFDCRTCAQSSAECRGASWGRRSERGVAGRKRGGVSCRRRCWSMLQLRTTHGACHEAQPARLHGPPSSAVGPPLLAGRSASSSARSLS